MYYCKTSAGCSRYIHLSEHYCVAGIYKTMQEQIPKASLRSLFIYIYIERSDGRSDTFTAVFLPDIFWDTTANKT